MDVRGAVVEEVVAGHENILCQRINEATHTLYRLAKMPIFDGDQLA